MFLCEIANSLQLLTRLHWLPRLLQTFLFCPLCIRPFLRFVGTFGVMTNVRNLARFLAQHNSIITDGTIVGKGESPLARDSSLCAAPTSVILVFWLVSFLPLCGTILAALTHGFYFTSRGRYRRIGVGVVIILDRAIGAFVAIVTIGSVVVVVVVVVLVLLLLVGGR